ncbi:MAG: IS200/IS605 family transposase, partial [bacterium]
MRAYNVAHQLYAHITWCTEKRVPLLESKIEEIFKDTIQEVCREENYQLIAAECVPDHIHLIVRFRPTHKLSDFIHLVKGRTSRLITRRTGQDFQWQKGYGIDTVGP